jgi:choloylglycine hydrolase
MTAAALAAGAALGGLGLTAGARACSRVLWAGNGRAVVVGRNMDWFNPIPADLWALPRGVARDGMTGANTLSWTSKYGSVVAAVAVRGRSLASTDGMNEGGLAGHMLWLAEADFGARDEARPGLGVALWLQYYLDNFATVDEAVAFTGKVPYQLVTQTFDGEAVTVHLALEDRTGDSAVIEFVGGRAKVYHGRGYTVMTNSPTFDRQLENLRRYQGFGGSRPLPGTTEAADRFVRASYYLKGLPEPADDRACVAGVLSVMRNVAQPFGTADPDRPNNSPTRWRTVGDLTHRVYYFESSTSPNIVWMKLGALDFATGAPAKRLDLTNAPDRVGDCSTQFEAAEPFPFPPPDLR